MLGCDARQARWLRRPTTPANAYLAVGSLGVLAIVVSPERLIDDVVYSVLGASLVAAILVGIRLHRPRATPAWYTLAAGQFLWVLADATFNLQQDVLHVDAFPTYSDALYLAGYPLFAVGLGLLARDRNARRDVGSLLDSATMTAGLGLLSWVLLARPTIVSLHHSVGAAAVAAAYPAMDILLVGVFIRLVSVPGGRSPAFRGMLSALVLLITADTVSVAFDLFATNTVSLVEYLWVASYVTWGYAALHPSMAHLSEPATAPTTRFRGVRLFAVILATLIAPAILAAQRVVGQRVDVWAVVIGSVVMFLLVVVRMNLAIEQIAATNLELDLLQRELAIQASHDPLTGLANRNQALRLLGTALSPRDQEGNVVGLLFVDLDGFKVINDTHGHKYGDEVLRRVSRRMLRAVRKGDFVARLGGDEFLIGMEDVSDEGAARSSAERLIAEISRPIYLSNRAVVKVGASVGIALGPAGHTDLGTLMHEADLAVYRAKAGGRGRAEVFSSDVRKAERERHDLQQALAHAIDADQLTVHYQPLTRLETGHVSGFEALVRWDRPGVGVVSPDEFLPIAESSDLICDLDAWVLRAAVRQLGLWNRLRRDRQLSIAVNVSGRHVSQTRISAEVAAVLRTAQIDPQQLIIEVTETAVVDGTSVVPNLKALRALGVRVSLDDFGTGYQSSTQLARLPVDIVKIDRRFVDTSSASSRSLLELMVKAARAFGLRVVAEGVERPDQLELVRELGCEYAQGFLLGRPTPAEGVAIIRDSVHAPSQQATDIAAEFQADPYRHGADQPVPNFVLAFGGVGQG